MADVAQDSGATGKRKNRRQNKKGNSEKQAPPAKQTTPAALEIPDMTVSTEMSSEMREELGRIAAEELSLKQKRMSDKDAKALKNTLDECKSTAEGIKGEIMEVLETRTDGEQECIRIEENIGKKLAVLTSEMNETAKECVESVPETTTENVPVATETKTASRDKRSPKSATPPATTENQKAIQDKISDLNKQETKKPNSKKKAIENILKSVEGIEDPKEKLMAVCEINQELQEQLKEAQANAEKWKKQFLNEQKDCNRSVLAKDRLEGLCRDLQKKNLAVKQDLELRRREEEERKKAISAKFQSTFTDISALMTDTQVTSTKLREDNTQLANKLRSLVNHYDIWEKHSEHMLHQKSIEIELAQARLRESQLHREKEAKEAEQLRSLFEMTVRDLKQQLESSLKKEIKLRQELSIHNQKYEEFQTAFDSSNKLFANFRDDVESMTKQTKKMESEIAFWKTRCEKSDCATARVMQEKISSDIKAETLTRLCRTLQEKLKLNPQELSSLEKSVASEVVSEEKAKMKAELAAKEAEILQQKEAIQKQQEEAKAKAAEELKAAEALKENIADVQAKIENVSPTVTVDGESVEMPKNQQPEKAAEKTAPSKGRKSASKKKK